MTVAQPRPIVRRGGLRGLAEYLRPQEAIPRRTYLGILIASAGGLLALWCVLTYGGFVESLFLPTPTAIVKSAAEMIGDGSLAQNAGASLYVIVRSGLPVASNTSSEGRSYVVMVTS